MAKMKVVLADGIQALLLSLQLLKLCHGSQQSCAIDSTRNEVFEGRFFERHSINTPASDFTSVAAPNIYACRHLCNKMPTCLAVTFSTSLSNSGLPCRLHRGQCSDNNLVEDTDSSTILLFKGDAKWPSKLVDGKWTQWEDIEPCPDPCLRVVVHQKRFCTNSSPQCGGLGCSGKDTRIKPCKSGECRDLSEIGSLPDGISYLNISSNKVAVNFDGEFLKFQVRTDGSENFYRNWNDYKYGFGNVDDEFWLGNEHIHQLTHLDYSTLRIDLSYVSESYSIKYDNFKLKNEENKYELQIGAATPGPGYPTLHDSLTVYNGLQFTTSDNDNDLWPNGNVASRNRGAWWFDAAVTSHLNGEYFQAGVDPPSKQGIMWPSWKGYTQSMTATVMKLKLASWS